MTRRQTYANSEGLNSVCFADEKIAARPLGAQFILIRARSAHIILESDKKVFNLFIRFSSIISHSPMLLSLAACSGEKL